MRKSYNSLPINIEPGFCILAAVLILLVPLKWIVAWFAATLLHELFHYIVIRINRIPVLSLTVGAHGIIMQTGPMFYRAELICALAGPLGALLLLLFARWFPALAVCAYIQSLYNLLPLYPLDGGRALRCFLIHSLPVPLAERLCAGIELCITLLMIGLGIYASFSLKLGPIPFAAAILLLFRCGRIKIPCKDGKQRVQYSKRNE